MMNQLTNVTLKPPYLIFIGDADNLVDAKTGAGILQWRPELVKGQLRFTGSKMTLGVDDMSIADAISAGVKSLVIGVAPVGGKVSDNWIAVLEEAARAGMDLVSGLHFNLEDFPQLVDAAKASGSALVNVRNPSPDLPVGNGKKRDGRRLLMVGTDCAVGKKYSALAISKAMQARGIKATFRATGQTGIMIAGSGVPIDTVVADFIAGAAEVISPDNDNDHWDVIEGQGSLFHPAYSGVSLGLLHGSQPDAIVVCHDATRETVHACSEHSVPTVAECIDLNLRCARLTNPNVMCVGVSINTSGLPEAERIPYLNQLQNTLELPCVDPLIDDCELIVDRIQQTT